MNRASHLTRATRANPGRVLGVAQILPTSRIFTLTPNLSYVGITGITGY
jgi:hypothetical protein